MVGATVAVAVRGRGSDEEITPFASVGANRTGSAQRGACFCTGRRKRERAAPARALRRRPRKRRSAPRGWTPFQSAPGARGPRRGMPPASCPSGRSIPKARSGSAGADGRATLRERPGTPPAAQTAERGSRERASSVFSVCSPPPVDGFPRTRMFAAPRQGRTSPIAALHSVFRATRTFVAPRQGRTSAHCGAAFGFLRATRMFAAPAAGAHVRPSRRCIRFSARRVCSSRRGRGARPSIAALYSVFRERACSPRRSRGARPSSRRCIRFSANAHVRRAAAGAHVCLSRATAFGFPRTRMLAAPRAGAHVRPSRRCIRFSA